MRPSASGGAAPSTAWLEVLLWGLGPSLLLTPLTLGILGASFLGERFFAHEPGEWVEWLHELWWERGCFISFAGFLMWVGLLLVNDHFEEG